MNLQAGDLGNADTAVQVSRTFAVGGQTCVLFRPSNG